ncbi:hypothetical protein [Pseudomonas sp. TH10]|uniref:hypothetical protein n=1 Tax=Pseudomonas sp. TH10 TaxID=2796376 RepID=UPI001F5B7B9E|nr:hypothetical protein [Pseudomonas sp. TH10]
MYIYEMIQASPNIEVKAKEHWGNEAAGYLQNVVNAHAEDGCAFYRSTLSAFPSSLVVSMRYWGRKMEPDRGGVCHTASRGSGETATQTHVDK